MQVQAHVLHTAACRFWHSHEVNRNRLVNKPLGEANGFSHSQCDSVNTARQLRACRAVRTLRRGPLGPSPASGSPRANTRAPHLTSALRTTDRAFPTMR